MKYMVLIYGIVRKVESPEGIAHIEKGTSRVHVCWRRSRAILLGAERLKSIETATALQETNDEREIIDGPFSETARGLMGYYRLECEDLDEAVGLANSDGRRFCRRVLGRNPSGRGLSNSHSYNNQLLKESRIFLNKGGHGYGTSTELG
jgi:hypothetical protein